MNVIGKILVFLNLVAALVVGGFLAVDFGTRKNYQKLNEALKNELEVSRTSGKQWIDTATKQRDEVLSAEKALKIERENRAKEKEDFESKEQVWQLQLAAEKQNSLNSFATSKRAQAEADSLKIEVKSLLDLLEKRNQKIREVQDELKTAQLDAKAYEQQASRTITRNEQLLDRVQKLEQKNAQLLLEIAQMKENAGAGGQVSTQAGKLVNPLQANPPPRDVQGEVVEVNPQNPALVKISLGSDHGLKKDHTVEAFRKSKYLGLIRIEQVFHRDAVGRHLQPNLGRLQVKDGVVGSLDER